MTEFDIDGLDRDHYGATQPVTGQGGIEYRYEITRPDWELSSATASDLGDVLLEVREMGRSRNPKKALLRDKMTEWDEADMYTFLRALLGKRFPHPAVNISVDNVAVYEALGRVFGPEHADSEDWGRHFTDEYDNTTVGLMEEAPQHPTDGVTPGDPPLNVFWGKWMYELAEESSQNRQADLLEAMFRRMEQPWILSQAVFCNFTLYCGSYMMLKAVNNEYELEEQGIDAWRAWRAGGDLPAFWLEVNRDEASEDMHPHRLHNTMKANSTSAESVAEDLDHDQWLAQTKYDGARLFVHHSGDGDVRAYSGGGNDVTAALPEVKEMDWPDCPFIFDAEATPYDADGNVVPFENIMTRLTREVDREAADPDDYDTEVVFKFFDCMYWRGRDITQQKYTDRWTIVKSVFEPDNLARTGEDLETTFHASVEADHEGLVLKQKDGEYMPGGRHGQWQKWKPEPETLDVKVLHVQQGSGRISDRMGALEVGLEHRGDIVPVGYVGTGFSDEERKQWWTDYETGDARGQVIELEYEEFQPNGGSWGLRFPSYQRRRPEGDVDTIERAAKLQNRHEEFDEWAEDETTVDDVA